MKICKRLICINFFPLKLFALYGMLYQYNKLLMLLITCFLLSPIATLWTAAFTPTQDVSCHLHSHSIAMPYVKGDKMLYRMPDNNRSTETGLVFLLHNYVLLCEILLPWQQSTIQIKLLETFQLYCSGVLGMVWKQNDSYSTFVILCGCHMLYIIVNTLRCWHWSLVFFFSQLLHCELLYLLLLRT